MDHARGWTLMNLGGMEKWEINFSLWGSRFESFYPEDGIREGPGEGPLNLLAIRMQLSFPPPVVFVLTLHMKATYVCFLPFNLVIMSVIVLFYSVESAKLCSKCLSVTPRRLNSPPLPLMATCQPQLSSMCLSGSWPSSIALLPWCSILDLTRNIGNSPIFQLL